MDRLLECLACGSKDLAPCLNLWDQPLANSFIDTPQELEKYPLKIHVCNSCTHCQLEAFVKPEILFTDYKYVSGTTTTLKQHFEQLASDCCELVPNALWALDIGCNDGSLLVALKEKGLVVMGIDPAKNLRSISKAKNVNVEVDFWTADKAYEMQRYEIITALNCLAHNPNPTDFLLGCKRSLYAYGRLVIEMPYFPSTIERIDLGQFYAEHHSYFTAKSFAKLAERIGFTICGIKQFPDIHGGTIRYVLKHTDKEWHCQELLKLVTQEKDIMAKIMNLGPAVYQLASAVSFAIQEYKFEEKTIVAYGASAKSSTLFNLPGMKNAAKCVSYIVDDSPLKQGLYCPGSNLPIKAPGELLNEKNLVVLLTVHNFKTEVLQRLRKAGVKGLLLNYIPHMSVEEI